MMMGGGGQHRQHLVFFPPFINRNKWKRRQYKKLIISEQPDGGGDRVGSVKSNSWSMQGNPNKLVGSMLMLLPLPCIIKGFFFFSP